MANVNRSGWYPDPSGAHQQRYFDGAGWTDRTRPRPSRLPLLLSLVAGLLLMAGATTVALLLTGHDENAGPAALPAQPAPPAPAPDDATPAPVPDPAEPSTGDGEPGAGTNGTDPAPDIEAFCTALSDATAVVSDGRVAEAHRERDAVALRELHLAHLARLEVAQRSAPPDLTDDLRAIVEYSSDYAQVMDAHDAWGADPLDQYELVEDHLGQDARLRENQAWGNLDLRLHEHCPE